MHQDQAGREWGRRARRLPRSLGIAAVAATALTAPALAQAAPVTVSYEGGVLKVIGTDAPDDLYLTHRADVTFNPNQWIGVQFIGGDLTAGANCVPSDPSAEAVMCPIPTRVEVELRGGDDNFLVDTLNDPPVLIPVTVDGGAGNDIINGSPVGSTLIGGPGDDVLRGREGDDILRGGDGDDTLLGRAGDDRLYGEGGKDQLFGEAGDDLLDGGAGDDELDGMHVSTSDAQPGADTYIGGPGTDRLSYFMRFAPITATLDGVADDGEAGEGDNIHPDVEEIGGGWGDDLIVGTDGPDNLWGSAGNDRILGLGGDDTIHGGDGADVIDGGAGDDDLKGGCHDDTIIGGPGVDSLISDDCDDAAKRGRNDRLEAADGTRDALIFCSLSYEAPADVAIVDPVDSVATSGPGACGTVRVVISGGGAGGGGAPGTKAPVGTVRASFGNLARLLTGTGRPGTAAKQRLRLTARTRTLTLGTLVARQRVKLTAAAGTRRGRARIGLGSTTVTLKAGAHRALTLRVPAAATRKLTGLKATPVTVVFTARNAKGKVVKRLTRSYRIAIARR